MLTANMVINKVIRRSVALQEGCCGSGASFPFHCNTYTTTRFNAVHVTEKTLICKDYAQRRKGGLNEKPS